MQKFVKIKEIDTFTNACLNKVNSKNNICGIILYLKKLTVLDIKVTDICN